MSDEDLKAELERLKAENERLKSSSRSGSTSLRVSEKGGVSVYGLGRFPVAFDKFAYSDGRCYGMKESDLKKFATRMPDPPATLQVREVELIVDFLMAKVVGKGPLDHAKCVDFWGADVEACRDLKR